MNAATFPLRSSHHGGHGEGGAQHRGGDCACGGVRARRAAPRPDVLLHPRDHAARVGAHGAAGGDGGPHAAPAAHAPGHRPPHHGGPEGRDHDRRARGRSRSAFAYPRAPQSPADTRASGGGGRGGVGGRGGRRCPARGRWAVPLFTLDVKLGERLRVREARYETIDGALTLVVRPSSDGTTALALSASNWTLPVGAPLTCETLAAQGMLKGQSLEVARIDGKLY